MPRVDIPENTEVDLSQLTLKGLLGIYNSLSSKPAKKFSDKKSAIRRTREVLDEIGASPSVDGNRYELPEGYTFDEAESAVRATKASSRTPKPRGKPRKEAPTDEEVLEGAKEQSPAKGRRLGVCDLIEHYLIQGVPNKEIPDLVHAEIPLSRCRVSDVYIVKSKMKKEGRIDDEGNVIERRTSQNRRHG